MGCDVIDDNRDCNRPSVMVIRINKGSKMIDSCVKETKSFLCFVFELCFLLSFYPVISRFYFTVLFAFQSILFFFIFYNNWPYLLLQSLK